MVILPLATLGYGWTVHKKVNVAGPVVFLFIAGFSLMWGYSSTLAYIVGARLDLGVILTAYVLHVG